MTDAIIISHSRIDPSFGKTSEVWTLIAEGAQKYSKKLGKELAVLAPTKSYHDTKEYYSLVEEAMSSTHKLILPFSEGSQKFVEMLNNFDGDICFVNTPPPEKWKKKLTQKIPYVGLDEFFMGQNAAQILLNIKKYPEVLVLRHENYHEGHNLRIEGITSLISVVELCIDPEDEDYVIPKEKRHLPVITLGIRGTEVALRSAENIIAIDSNEKIEAFFKNGEIIAVLTQNPTEQGQFSAGKIFSGNKEDYLMRSKILFR